MVCTGICARIHTGVHAGDCAVVHAGVCAGICDLLHAEFVVGFVLGFSWSSAKVCAGVWARFGLGLVSLSFAQVITL